MLEQIKNFMLSFFEKLSVDITDMNVKQEWDNIFFLKLETKDSWILIWNHGSVFESLQWIFRKILREKFWREIIIHLEINDYIYSKDAKLFAFIEKEINKAKETGRNMKLPVLNSYERKKVHSYIADLNDSEIITESRWEWKQRRLFIVLEKNLNRNWVAKINTKDTNSKLEIDIDWDDI